MKHLLFLVFAISLNAGINAQSLPAKFKSPNYFHVDKDIQNPVAIPVSILKQILRDGDSGQVINDEDAKIEHLRTTVKARYITLENQKKKALLIQGENGANNTGFWIWERQGNSWKMILKERGLDLTLKRLPSSGHRSIEVSGCWVDGCRVRLYRFNGKSYTPSVCYDISDAGKRYFKCPASSDGPWPSVQEIIEQSKAKK